MDNCPLCRSKLCPRCQINSIEKNYALSRKDNKTRVCSECGTIEGIEDYLESRGSSPEEAQIIARQLYNQSKK